MYSAHILADNFGNNRVYVLPGIVRASNALVKRSDIPEQLERQAHLGRRLLLGGLGRRLFPLWSIVKTINVLPQMLVARGILRNLKPDIVVTFRTQNEGYIAAMTGTTGVSIPCCL